MSPDSARSWTHSGEDSRLLRALAVLPAAVLGTGVLGVAVAIVGLTVALFAGGNYVLGVAVLLAVAVMSARVVPLHFARVDGTRSVLDRLRELGARNAALAAVVGVAVWAVGATLGRLGFGAVVVGTVLLPLAVRTLLVSEGRVDSEATTLTYCGSDLNLAALDSVRRWAVGGYAVYRLSFVAGGATFGTPRWLVVPRHADSFVRPALDAGVERDPGDPGPARRGVRLVAGAIGAGLLGVAALVLTVDSTTVHPRGEAVVWYAALVAGGLGALFVAVGVRGG